MVTIYVTSLVFQLELLGRSELITNMGLHTTTETFLWEIQPYMAVFAIFVQTFSLNLLKHCKCLFTRYCTKLLSISIDTVVKCLNYILILNVFLSFIKIPYVFFQDFHSRNYNHKLHNLTILRMLLNMMNFILTFNGLWYQYF